MYILLLLLVLSPAAVAIVLPFPWLVTVSIACGFAGVIGAIREMDGRQAKMMAAAVQDIANRLEQLRRQ